MVLNTLPSQPITIKIKQNYNQGQQKNLENQYKKTRSNYIYKIKQMTLKHGSGASYTIWS